MTMYDKIAEMKPEQKNHWYELPELSYWGERFFAEFSVAQEVALPEEMGILEKAIDLLYADFCAQHALTDDACKAAEACLLVFSERAKSFNLHCVAHAHIDMDWMWGLHETIDVCLSTFRTMLDMMDDYPDFTFSQSQCAVYRLAEFYDPDLFHKMKQRIQEGRFEFAGSTWVELDKNMPNLESMARQILYTKQYLNQKFGISFQDVNLDFHPDSFGHSADIPQIFRAGGIRYFYHCRGLDCEYFYRWRGTSGAEVLALNEPLWYNDAIRPLYLHQVPKFCAKYGIRDMMKVYGVGDHGGGPTRQDIERILDMQTWPVAPTVFFSTYKRYFEAVEPFKENFPILTGELGPTFTGCYTSQSQIKQSNRVGEDRLFLAEALTAFAVKETGMKDFNNQFRIAWERILFNQFHDILPGSNTPESKYHALGAFEEALGCAMAASGAALRSFADTIDTSCFETSDTPIDSRSEGAGAGLNTDRKNRYRMPSVERGRGKTRLLHFFNPTGFCRDQVLEATVWDWPGDPARIRAYDIQGNSLPVSATTMSGTDWGHIRTDILIKVKIDAFSYTTVRIEEGGKTNFCFCELPPDPRVTYFHPLIMENDLVRVEFHEEDLSIRRYVDKKTGKDLLGPGGGCFVLYQERNTPSGGCGWREGLHMDPKNLHKCGITRLKKEVHKGTLRQTLEYSISYQESSLQVLAKLDNDSSVLELDVTACWLEKATDAGSPKLSFRLELPEEPFSFLSDSQIGVQKRLPDPMHDWCSRNFYHDPGTGATLLTDSKYGYRGYGKNMEVSLLRSSSKPDPFPELGERAFRIGVTTSSSDLDSLKALGCLFSLRDLPYASNRAHKGTLPLQKQLMKVDGATVTAVKIAEDRSGIILRLSVPLDSSGVSLLLPGMKKAVQTDLAEQPIREYTIVEDSVFIREENMDILTLKLIC